MIREEIIENLWGNAIRRNLDISKGDIEDIVDFVIKHYEQELSKDVEKAAEDYYYNTYTSAPFNYKKGVIVDFKAGAKWAFSQGGAIECGLFWYDGPVLDMTTEELDDAIKKTSIDIGDKVVVQIRKK